jgi:hypothetical protein
MFFLSFVVDSVDIVFVELTEFKKNMSGIHVLTVLFIALNGIPPNFGEPGTSTAGPPKILREHRESPGDQIAGNDLLLATYNSLPI